MICRSKRNMINPYTTQSISNHPKWAVFRLLQGLHWPLCPASSCNIWDPHSPAECNSDNHLWLQPNVCVWWERLSSNARLGPKIRGDLLRHWCWNLIQSVAGTIMDSLQLHYAIHSSSGHEIRWWRWQSDHDRWKASVHGVENYFTDSFLYQDPLEAVEGPSLEDLNSSEAGTEPKVEE